MICSKVSLVRNFKAREYCAGKGGCGVGGGKVVAGENTKSRGQGRPPLESEL